MNYLIKLHLSSFYTNKSKTNLEKVATFVFNMGVESTEVQGL